MSSFSCLLHKDSFGFFFISMSVATINVGPALTWRRTFTPGATFFDFNVSNQHRLWHSLLEMQNMLHTLWSGVTPIESPVYSAVDRLFTY